MTRPDSFVTSSTLGKSAGVFRMEIPQPILPSDVEYIERLIEATMSTVRRSAAAYAAQVSEFDPIRMGC